MESLGNGVVSEILTEDIGGHDRERRRMRRVFADTFSAVGIIGRDTAGGGKVQGTCFADCVGVFFLGGGLVFAGGGFGLEAFVSLAGKGLDYFGFVFRSSEIWMSKVGEDLKGGGSKGYGGSRWVTEELFDLPCRRCCSSEIQEPTAPGPWRNQGRIWRWKSCCQTCWSVL